MTTYTSLDEANKKIAELEMGLESMRVQRVRLSDERDSAMKESARVSEELGLESLKVIELQGKLDGRKAIIEALTRECASTRAFARDVVQEALAICRLAGAKLPANVVSCAKAAGFDVG